MLTAALEGALNAIWPICLVIVAALYTYVLTLETGAMEKIKKMEPLPVVVGCLVVNSMPTAFGSVGVPIATISATTGLAPVEIAANTAKIEVLISAVIGGLIQGASPIKLLHVFARTVRTNVRTFVTIMCVLGTAKIMSYSGMTSDMAAFLVAVTGSYYPFIPPLIGTLGGFVTGSGTSTCVLFGPMQVQTAKAIGADPAWLVAANTCGAGIGKMISPQGIAIGAASAGLSGSESRLMASVMKYCILFVVVAGVLSYFLQ